MSIDEFCKIYWYTKPTMHTKNKVLKLITAIGICLLAGGIGSFFTAPAISTWYVTLQKPFFNPPNWVFGPVWTTLYILMGISLYQFWVRAKTDTLRNQGFMLFGLQLLFNILWSVMFFGLKSLELAFVTILILWVLIFKTILSFRKTKKSAGWLLVPYLMWVSFATLLNFAIMMLN